MKKVLITGGAGFVGLHVARALLAGPDVEILLVDNLRRGRRDDEVQALLADRRCRLLEGDLCEVSTFEAAGKGFDEVYHLAAVIGVRNVMERPQDVIRVNALSTLRVLDWMAAGGGRKLLFSSTSEAYAWTQHVLPLPVPTPEAVPLALTDLANPRSSYAGSKIFGELAVTQYGRAHAFPFVIVRLHNVYGARMGYEHVIPELHERVRQGQTPLVVYATDHRRAFCHVDDAIALMQAAMANPAADGQTLNIGNDQEEVTIGDLAQRILRRAGSSASLEARPAPHDPIKRRCPDMRRTCNLLNIRPRVTLDMGLDRTLSWYDTHPRPPLAR
ncbi:MAG: NAD(P)-dependent oxidoreductase [Lentisphaerae bacterium]|nr:NAD(P)-dependent oxidoreductase [Lentisphaerota bacterium]